MWEKIRNNENILTLVLVLALVSLVSASIASANLVRSIDMQPILLGTGILGVLTGFALAKSRFPGLTAFIYGIVYGVFVSGYLIGRTYEADMIWRERVADMVIRQVEFFTKVYTGNTNRDAMVFVMHTALVIWLLGVTASWWTFRRTRIWLVIIPGALVMLSVIYYANPILTAFLGAYCLVTMLYIAQTHLLDNQRAWQRSYVRYNRSIGGNFLVNSLLAAALVLIIVWRAPALPANAAVGDAINQVNRPWREVRDNWQRLYSALNAQATTTADPYRDSLTLGGPRNPTDTPIMDVYTEELPYAYWRSTIMDSYDAIDGEWTVAEGETVTVYPDDGELDIPRDRDRQEVVQNIVNYIPNAGTIYAAPELISSDRQILVKTSQDNAGRTLVSAARSRYLMQLGDRYEVTSRLSVADQTDLRTAPINYPPHIVDQYLDVPEEITPRTRDLALRLTEPYDNPYDKALSVQNYLRNTMVYSDQIDAPPSNVEPVDFFLFESQTGYCNYYASSFAMMLRVAGVPTRLSRGYAAGEYNEDNQVYRVRARDAHVWPEAYFPGFGWIQFEPTVILSAIDRPIGEGEEVPEPGVDPNDLDDLVGEDADEPNTPEELDELLGNEDEEDDEVPAGLEQGGVPPWLAAINPFQVLGAIFSIGIAAALILFAERQNRKVEGTLDGSYGRLERWGRFLRVPMMASQTPHERAQLLSTAVPDGEEPIRYIVNEFERKQFSPEKESGFLINTLEQWKVLRPIFLKTGLRSRLPARFRKDTVKPATGD